MNLGEFRSSVRSAARVPLLFEGTVTRLGIESPWTMHVSPAGKFALRIVGRVPRSIGFDGSAVWAADASGTSRTLLFDERDAWYVPLAAATHAWLDGPEPARAAIVEPGDGPDVTIAMSLDESAPPCRLVFDRTTRLPRAVIVPGNHAGGQRWEFTDFREAHGTRFPHTLVHTKPGTVNTYRVDRVRSVASIADAAFSPTPSPRRAVFPPEPRPVSLELAVTGHLVCRPRLSGREAGAFIFDTGAGVPLVSRAAAEAAGMAAFGRTAMSGAGAAIREATLRDGAPFELGGVEMPDLCFLEADLSSLSGALGVEIEGVVGYDVLARTVAEIDLAAPSITLHDPGAYRLAGGSWQELLLRRNHPLVRCRFEGDREGLFLWDTGAGSAPVIFTAPTVQRLGLLDERETTTARAMGAGGEMEVRIGTLAYLEIAGRRMEQVQAVFPSPQEGALGDPCIAGLIGNPLLTPFRVVMNYPAGLIAFVEKVS
ncbi:MAG: retropepsin-like domain-containing protein [Acidobacteria bacterium]|nr:retropepsin-like domain-containing protein [Acidobacteriota bacterium]